MVEVAVQVVSLDYLDFFLKVYLEKVYLTVLLSFNFFFKINMLTTIF